MIFNILGINTTEIEDIRARLWDGYNTASGVNATQSDYDILFTSYGY